MKPLCWRAGSACVATDGAEDSKDLTDSAELRRVVGNVLLGPRVDSALRGALPEPEV